MQSARPRLGISGLMVLIAVLALAITSLRGATSAWVTVVFVMTTCTLIGISMRATLARSQGERLWCLGFALFGWAHLLLAGSQWRPEMPTDWLGLWFVESVMAAQFPFPTRGPGYTNVMHSANNEFWRAATKLVSLYLTLLTACMGGYLMGWLGRYRHPDSDDRPFEGEGE
jgi:hypothetical protein